MKLTHGELFAGVSGFGYGFGLSGIKTLWHAEIDEGCKSVLRYHYPDTPIYHDVRGISLRTGKGWRRYYKPEPVDIVTFGSPCQDLSIAGKRDGLDGSRSGLFYEAIRIVKELRPSIAIFENVMGAFSSNSGRDFAAVLGAFYECGARDIAWRSFDARYFGVAQRRRRVFVVADFTGERAGEILFEPESSSRDFAPRAETRARVAHAVARGAGGSGYRYDANGEDFIVSHALKAEGADASEDGTGSGVPMVCGSLGGVPPSGGWRFGADEAAAGQLVPMVCAALGSAHGGPDDNAAQARHLVAVSVALRGRDGELGNEQATALRSIQGGGDKAHVLVSSLSESGAGTARTGNERTEAEMLVTGAAIAQSNRGTAGNTAETVRADCHGAQLMTAGAFGVRRLTPLECERLMGWPDEWTRYGIRDGRIYEQSDSARYRQCGNGVVGTVSAWIGRRIVEVIS